MLNAQKQNSNLLKDCQAKSSLFCKPYILGKDQILSISSLSSKTAGLFVGQPCNNEFEQAFLDFNKKKEKKDQVPLKPILDKISDGLWNVDQDQFPVAGRKCSCKSVWCPTCFKFRYHERIQEIFAPFDWESTRQVVLTVNPDLFQSPSESLQYIRDHHSVGEFIRRLRRGVKIKSGSRWVWKYQPINIIRWAWFMEFHSNGFPHFHVFIQTDCKGRAGMLGGEFLRDSWKLALWVKETYFKSEDHFKNLTGYYADKGYFEKGKEYQGRLPDEIMDKFQRRIKRMNTSERKRQIKQEDEPVMDGDEMNALNEEIPNPLELANYVLCESYFEEMAGLKVDKKKLDEVMNSIEQTIEDCEKPEEIQAVNYRVMIERCGKRTYIELDLREYRLSAVCDLNYYEWKKKVGGLYCNKRGYVCKLKRSEIVELLQSVSKVIALNKYLDVHECIRLRENQISREKADREWEEANKESVLMQK